MIIDFRLRPPVGKFLELGIYASDGRNKQLARTYGFDAPAPSALQRSPELMLQEMDKAGINLGVIPGRMGHFKGSITNDELIKIVEGFNGRFIGLAGLNPLDYVQSVEEIDRTVLHGPLKGVCIEPAALPEPLYAHDKSLYPIYAECERHELPVLVMIGGGSGPDITYSNPEIICQLARDFPKINFIVAHGGWPWVQETVGACFLQKNIYLSPDVHMFSPGAQDYVAAVHSYLADRLIFASAYPFLPLIESVARFKTLFTEEELPKLMYKNAATVLKLDI